MGQEGIRGTPPLRRLGRGAGVPSLRRDLPDGVDQPEVQGAAEGLGQGRNPSKVI